MRASGSSHDDGPILENSIAGVMPYTHKRQGDERAASRKGEQVRVAYRGTDWRNMSDIVTDAAMAAGVENRAVIVVFCAAAAASSSPESSQLALANPTCRLSNTE